MARTILSAAICRRPRRGPLARNANGRIDNLSLRAEHLQVRLGALEVVAIGAMGSAYLRRADAPPQYRPPGPQRPLLARTQTLDAPKQRWSAPKNSNVMKMVGATGIEPVTPAV